MRTIDLNADLGEGGSHDAELMALASSVNIACGGHAGNATTMRTAIELAITHQVAIGAHPGYEDPRNFGRLPLKLPLQEISDLVSRQLETLASITSAIHHVKPHGALYNQAHACPDIAAAVIAGINRVLPRTILYAPPSGAFEQAATAAGHTVSSEGFADRRYGADGSLVPRSHANAVIHAVQEAVSQAREIAEHQRVRTIDGSLVPLPARTLCIHGDGPQAVTLLATLRTALEAAGFTITAH